MTAISSDPSTSAARKWFPSTSWWISWEEIAGIKLKKRNYNLDAPLGVRGRSSDNTLIQKLLGWQPSTRLKSAWKKPIAWIYDQMSNPAIVQYHTYT